MVIKIFYFVIAIFSVAMIFLASSDPYHLDLSKHNLSVVNMQVDEVVDFEINSSKISAKYEADELKRYSDRDEFMKFKAEIQRDNLRHFVSADKVELKGDDIKFLNNVKYENNESLNFNSDMVIYNQKNKLAVSNSDFVMWQNEDKVIGKALKYDTKNRQIEARGVKAWVEQKR